jgi:hypothetical protein
MYFSLLLGYCYMLLPLIAMLNFLQLHLVPIIILILRFYLFNLGLILRGARGGVVVKALRYKPEGRGFDS